MTGITTLAQRKGIVDFLKQLPTEMIISLAKVISQNLSNPQTVDDAIDVILLHSPSVEAILNRKVITKDILFQYLHSHQIPVTDTSTKFGLITKVINCFNKKYERLNNVGIETSSTDSFSQQSIEVSKNAAVSERTSQQKLEPQNQSQAIISNSFPISQMAEEFSKWFFDTYNNDGLGQTDFWNDATISVQMVQDSTGDADIQSTESDRLCIDLLKTIKNQYNFHFNANLTNNGVQGRMDVHGLAYVMNCGTLHVQTNFVGVYECAFGLLRDPFADNNWKIKHLKMRLRSENGVGGSGRVPSLQDCESLREMLAIQSGTEIK